MLKLIASLLVLAASAVCSANTVMYYDFDNDVGDISSNYPANQAVLADARARQGCYDRGGKVCQKIYSAGPTPGYLAVARCGSFVKYEFYTDLSDGISDGPERAVAMLKPFLVENRCRIMGVFEENAGGILRRPDLLTPQSSHQ